MQKLVKMDEFEKVDPQYSAWFYFRMGEYDKCAQTATEMLKMDPEAQLPWAIKLIALTEEIKILNEDESAECLGKLNKYVSGNKLFFGKSIIFRGVNYFSGN